MPPKKSSEYVVKSQGKIYYPVITVRMRRTPPNTELYPSAKKACSSLGITLPEYCKISVFEKLQRDGYLASDVKYTITKLKPGDIEV